MYLESYVLSIHFTVAIEVDSVQVSTAIMVSCSEFAFLYASTYPPTLGRLGGVSTFSSHMMWYVGNPFVWLFGMCASCQLSNQFVRPYTTMRVCSSFQRPIVMVINQQCNLYVESGTIVRGWSRIATDFPGMSQDVKGHLAPETLSSVLGWTD